MTIANESKIKVNISSLLVKKKKVKIRKQTVPKALKPEHSEIKDRVLSEVIATLKEGRLINETRLDAFGDNEEFSELNEIAENSVADSFDKEALTNFSKLSNETTPLNIDRPTTKQASDIQPKLKDILSSRIEELSSKNKKKKKSKLLKSNSGADKYSSYKKLPQNWKDLNSNKKTYETVCKVEELNGECNDDLELEKSRKSKKKAIHIKLRGRDRVQCLL